VAGAAAIRGGGVAIEIGADTRRFFAALNAMQARMRALGSTINSIGARMTAMGAAATAPFALAARQSAAFQDTMSAVGAVTDATGADFQALKDKAMALGASTSFTAQQVAEGMQALGQGGFTVQETLGAIDGTLLLARAGMLDLGAATEITVATLRSFKMPAQEAGKVADILAMAANSSNATVQGLGEALSTIGGIASTAGASLTEVTAAIGLLADRGMQGSEAGTALRRVLIGLAQEQKALRNMGVEVKDPKTGKLKPLKVILAELKTAMAGMDDTDRIAKLSKIFDVFGANAVLQLMNAGDSLETLDQKLQNSGGSAARVATQMDDNLGGSMRMLSSAIESVALAVGEALTPALRSIMDYMSQLAAGIAEAVARNQGFIVAIAGSAAAVTAAGTAFLGLGTTLQVGAFALGGFTKTLGLVIAPVSMLVGTASGITSSFARVVGAVASITTPLITASGAMVAFAARSVAAAANYIASLVAMTAATLTNMAIVGASWIGAGIAATGAFLAHIKALITYYTGQLAFMTAITITRLGQTAAAWASQAIAGMAAWLGATVVAVAGYLGQLALAVGGTVAAAASMAAAWLAPAAPFLAVAAAVYGLGKALQSVGGSGGSIASSLTSMFQPISAGFQQVLADATIVFSDLWNTATTTFAGISDAIMAGDMSLAFEVLWAGLQAAWLRGQQAVMGYIDGFVEYLQNRWGDMSTSLAVLITQALGAVERAWIYTTGAMFSAWDSAVSGILNVWDTAIGAIQKAIAYIRSFFDETIDYEAIERQIDEANKARKEGRESSARQRAGKRQEQIDQSVKKEEDTVRILVEDNASNQRDRAERTAQRAGDREYGVQQADANLGNARARAEAAREGADLIKQAAEASSTEDLAAYYQRAKQLLEKGLITQEQFDRIEAAVDAGAEKLDDKRVRDANTAEREAEAKAANEAAAGVAAETSKAEVAGTFSAMAVGGLSYGSNLAERTAKACEKIAENTKPGRNGAEVQA
jgi:TP901 family phage tail tape measure protein